MDTVALIIIYNHQFDKNIPILEDIYKDRFTNIYHLVPFYQGNKANVIAVYENSYYFQGYIAQGIRAFFKQEYKHYIFVADDLMLNPDINESNYALHFSLNDETCFIPGFINLDETKPWPNGKNLMTPWARVAEAFYYRPGVAGIEAKDCLPDNDTAKKAFGRFNLSLKPLQYHQIWATPQNLKGVFNVGLKKLLQFTKNKIFGQTHELPYPLVGSYSDICIVSADCIKLFCHFCGVTAATRLFVEVGLPTALVLSSKAIVTESSLKLKGKPLWTKEDYLILEKYDQSLKALIDDFPKDLLYIHPVKLSKWTH